jgi:radical SAM superfamily enzyme YgiQ (UPF0313 family)
VINSPTIVLATLNAKYIHPSLGLRYLLANMGDLKPQTAIREFTIARSAQEVVDELICTLKDEGPASEQETACSPIIGFGVYIWNVRQTTAVVRLLKATRPDITVILGGPEVSYEADEQEITHLADFVITGWGDRSFARLCHALLKGERPLAKVIAGEQPKLDQIVMPYAEYSDTDLAHRIVYVEASRGCPFKCEFCLSALDKTAWAFDLDVFLGEMDRLYQRGARNFKFLDRTFNLKIDIAVRILQFFLDRLTTSNSAASTDRLFVHFEAVPDHLPSSLKTLIAQFPPGVLQFEIGIQTFTVEVQQRISRPQDNDKAQANLRWLVSQSNANVHVDLLFGLPGETLESFASGFDRLYAMSPSEIQLGTLKRLRGTKIVRHAAEYGMIYDTAPPYSLKETNTIDAATFQRIARFARYWELIANSGRFRTTLPLLLNDHMPNDEDEASSAFDGNGSPFQAFLRFSDWLWQRTGKTGGLSPELLVDALSDYLCNRCALPSQKIKSVLLSDYLDSGSRGSPLTLRGLLPKRQPPLKSPKAGKAFLGQQAHLVSLR